MFKGFKNFVLFLVQKNFKMCNPQWTQVLWGTNNFKFRCKDPEAVWFENHYPKTPAINLSLGENTTQLYTEVNWTLHAK